MERVLRTFTSQAKELGTLFSLTVFLVFVNEIGVPELSRMAYIFAILLYIGGLVTGYGSSLERP